MYSIEKFAKAGPGWNVAEVGCLYTLQMLMPGGIDIDEKSMSNKSISCSRHFLVVRVPSRNNDLCPR
jgi:hypothetical protein